MTLTGRQFAQLCHGNSIERALRADAHDASCRCDGTSPLCGSFCSEDPQCGSGDEVALHVAGVVNCSVNVEEALGRSSRLEPLQLALASSDCLMRILCPIILAEPCLCGQAGRRRRNAEASERSLSVISNLEAQPCFLSSLRISRNAARVSRRRWTSMSKTSPLWVHSTHRYIRSPAIRTTISSRCQQSLGRGRYWRSRRAITGPNFSTQRRTVS